MMKLQNIKWDDILAATKQCGEFLFFQYTNDVLPWFICQFILKTDACATTLLYAEIPKYCTWTASKKQFERRRQGRAIEGQTDVENYRI